MHFGLPFASQCKAIIIVIRFKGKYFAFGELSSFFKKNFAKISSFTSFLTKSWPKTFIFCSLTPQQATGNVFALLVQKRILKAPLLLIGTE